MSTNRIIVKFNGGLGNQMFQWAYARAIAYKFNMDMYFDMSFFEKSYSRPFELGIFGLKPNKIVDNSDKFKMNVIWKFRKFFHEKAFMGMNFYAEPHFEYDKKLLLLPPETYVEGFFQTEKYFQSIPELIRKDFKFKNELDERNKAIADDMAACNSISLHIRRGDYVQKKRYQDTYATCSLEYYKKAVSMITQGHNDTKLFVFSDDIPWVKENLELSFKTTYVDFNTGENSYKDMQLMSLCKHNVIANSSFSWWGAWLNDNHGKMVIAPKKWFKDDSINQSDVIPKSWIRIDN